MHPTQNGDGEFARLLAAIQNRAGLTDQAIAEIAGVNRSQVWRWTHSGSAPGYEPVRRLAAWLIAERPEVAGTAAALLPAAGYETPPGLAAARPRRRSFDPGADGLETYIRGVHADLAAAMAEHGPGFTPEQAFPETHEQATWDDPDELLTQDERIRLIAWMRKKADEMQGRERRISLSRARHAGV